MSNKLVINENTNPIVMVGVIEMQKEIIKSLEDEVQTLKGVIRDLSSAMVATPKAGNVINVYNGDNR